MEEGQQGTLSEGAAFTFDKYAIPQDKLTINSYDPIMTRTMYLESIKHYNLMVNALLDRLVEVSGNALREVIQEKQIPEEEATKLLFIQVAIAKFVQRTQLIINEEYDKLGES